MKKKIQAVFPLGKRIKLIQDDPNTIYVPQPNNKAARRMLRKAALKTPGKIRRELNRERRAQLAAAAQAATTPDPKPEE